MPEIALELRAIDFVTDENVIVRAWRAFAEVRFKEDDGSPIRYPAFVDPGAPFCLIPYSLWRGRRMQWTRLGSKLLWEGRLQRGALAWQGVPCDLGMTNLRLIDLDNRICTGPHRVVAKFPRRKLPPVFENAAILGMNYLADNELRLVLEGGHDGMTGFLSVSGS